MADFIRGNAQANIPELGDASRIMGLQRDESSLANFTIDLPGS